MPAAVRPFLPADQEAIARMLRAVWADDAGAIHYFAAVEDFTSQAGFRRTLVAEVSGLEGPRIVGFGSVGVGSYHPNFASLKIIVEPSYQNRGIGGALYERLIQILGARSHLPIKTATYEDQRHALAFLQHRGFRIWMRTYLPVLELSSFDPTLCAEASDRIAERGYRVSSMADLAQDTARDEKLAELHYRVYASIHPNNPPGPVLYEQRFQAFLGDNLLPEALYVAVRGEAYVAVASLRIGPQPETLEQGWFGALPAYHEDDLDLVLALVLREVEYARKQRVQRITAEIDDVDTLGMILLERLPFRSGPAWVTLVKG